MESCPKYHGALTWNHPIFSAPSVFLSAYNLPGCQRRDLILAAKGETQSWLPNPEATSLVSGRNSSDPVAWWDILWGQMAHGKPMCSVISFPDCLHPGSRPVFLAISGAISSVPTDISDHSHCSLRWCQRVAVRWLLSAVLGNRHRRNCTGTRRYRGVALPGTRGNLRWRGEKADRRREVVGVDIKSVSCRSHTLASSYWY